MRNLATIVLPLTTLLASSGLGNSTAWAADKNIPVIAQPAGIAGFGKPGMARAIRANDVRLSPLGINDGIGLPTTALAPIKTPATAPLLESSARQVAQISPLTGQRPSAAADLTRLAADSSAAPVSERLNEAFDNAPARPGESKIPPASLPFRLHIREPGIYLLERDGKTGDDSNGLRLAASLDAGEVRAAIGALVLEKGESALRGERLFVTGVEMGLEKEAAERVRGYLSEAGVNPENLAVQILSIPRAWAKGSWPALRDRIVYFFPSLRRDYQAPLRDEIIVNFVVTAILETPNALFLLSFLPRPDAWLVLGAHAALLTAYNLFQRSMTNWLLRARGTEVFIKQTLTSLPFVLNYNILGNYSALAAYAGSMGAAAMLGRLPAELLKFAATQGLTLLLQTVFYAWVVLHGFRGWSANQKSPEDSAAARSWVTVLLLPWLWLDSIFLTQAATASAVLGRMGPLILTTGHVYLAALTAAGSVFVYFPRLLDATLPWYKKIRGYLCVLWKFMFWQAPCSPAEQRH